MFDIIGEETIHFMVQRKLSDNLTRMISVIPDAVKLDGIYKYETQKAE